MTTMDTGVGQGRGLWFTAARHAELLDEQVPAPGDDQVTVRATASMVSAGTEMLVYRGQIPADDDLGLETCAGTFGFPVKYAYQVVGEVVAAGAATGYRPGEKVFARHPHQDLFTMRDDSILLFRLPDGLAPERAVFANLLDVALNCNLDVPVRHGDCVVVYGQGIVGSLTAQLARRMERRMAHMFRLLGDAQLQTVVSHTFPFDRAPEAYRRLDEAGASAMGVVLTYPPGT